MFHVPGISYTQAAYCPQTVFSFESQATTDHTERPLLMSPIMSSLKRGPSRNRSPAEPRRVECDRRRSVFITRSRCQFAPRRRLYVMFKICSRVGRRSGL